MKITPEEITFAADKVAKYDRWGSQGDRVSDDSGGWAQLMERMQEAGGGKATISMSVEPDSIDVTPGD